MRRQEYPRLGSKENNNDNTNRPNDGRDDWKIQYARSHFAGTNGDSATSQAGHDSTTTGNMSRMSRADDDRGMLPGGVLEPAQEARRLDLEAKEQDLDYTESKRVWKQSNPDQTAKFWKDQYIKGKVDKLPWENNE
jgi:hypothetical protein